MAEGDDKPRRFRDLPMVGRVAVVVVLTVVGAACTGWCVVGAGWLWKAIVEAWS